MLYSCLICGKMFEAAPAAHRKFCSRSCMAIAKTTQIERTCERCGKTFLARRYAVLAGKAHFCSRACANSGWDDACEMCGKPVHRTPHQANTQKHAFCSRECYWAFRNNKIERICQQCGKAFLAKACDVAKGNGKFCSNACYHASQFLGLTTFTCKQCGKEFSIRTGFVNAHMFNGTYCSRECMGLAHRLPGSNAAAYSYEFTETLKESIRERDHRQCQLCGLPEAASARILAVHHIDYDKTNNHGSNLITLCHSCHSKTNANKETWKARFMSTI